MQESEFLKVDFENLLDLGIKNKEKYLNEDPYPYGVFDNFFVPEKIKALLAEFPVLGDKKDLNFKNPNEVKLASKGEYKFGAVTTSFVHLLNSQPFLEFLSNLTGIENLIPDPYFWGGGFHEIKPGGYLKIHADFNQHPSLSLDRRLNLLVYLNEDWDETFGGNFELWDKNMKVCVKKILPIFNRMVIFSTSNNSFHGHPDPLTCPPDRSRKSLALYYYTNGLVSKVAGATITTDFRAREGSDSWKVKAYNQFIKTLLDFIPPIILKVYKKRQ